MRRLALLLVLLALVTGPAGAVETRVALLDFMVHSDDPNLRLIGKGLSELVALELGNAPGMALVDRSQCLKALSASHMSPADVEKSTVIAAAFCRTVKANWLILGSVAGADGQWTFTLRLLLGSNGTERARTQLTDALSSYESVCASLAEWVIPRVYAEVAASTADKARAKRHGSEEALIAFSSGIDSYDRGDAAQAEGALKRAAELNPQCQGIAAYLREVTNAGSAKSLKYRIEPVFYAFPSNPADLGFTDHSSLHWRMLVGFRPPGATFTDEWSYYQVIDGYEAMDENRPMSWELVMPLGRRLGVGAQFILGGYSRYLRTPDPLAIDSETTAYPGGALAAGYRFREDMSLGGSVAAWRSGEGPGVYFSVETAYMLKAVQELLSFGVVAVYTNQTERYRDPSTVTVEEGFLPLLLEVSAVYALPGKRLFLSGTGRSEIYIDGRGGHALTALPLVEYRPSRRLALRAGGEYSHMAQGGEFAAGYGALAGASLRFRRIELDGDMAIRQKPLRLLPGHTISEWSLGIAATVDVSRRRR